MADTATLSNPADSTGLDNQVKQARQQASDAGLDVARAQSDIDINKAKGEEQLYGDLGQKQQAITAQRDANVRDFAEFHPTQENGSDLMKMFGLLATISFMSGGHGRQYGLDAMKNATGAMQGLQQGQKERFQNEMQEFQRNMEANKAHNEAVERQYRDAIDTLATDRQAGLAKLKVAEAMAGKDSLLPLKARQGQLDEVLKGLDTQKAAQQKLQDTITKLQVQHQEKMEEIQKREQLHNVTSGMQAAQMDQAHVAYLGALMNLNPTKFSSFTSGWARNPMRALGMKASIDKSLAEGKSPEDWAKSITDRDIDISGARAQEAVFAKSDPFVRNVQYTAQRVKDVANRLKMSDSGLANKGYIWLTENLHQNKDIKQLIDAINIHISEFATAMRSATGAGSGGTDAARHEFQEALNKTSSIDSINAVVDQHIEMLKHRQQNYKESRADLLDDSHPAAGLSDQDKQAIDWAKAHPGDPRSDKILSLHGMK
jgi:hypothetical protein